MPSDPELVPFQFIKCTALPCIDHFVILEFIFQELEVESSKNVVAHSMDDSMPDYTKRRGFHGFGEGERRGRWRVAPAAGLSP